MWIRIQTACQEVDLVLACAPCSWHIMYNLTPAQPWCSVDQVKRWFNRFRSFSCSRQQKGHASVALETSQMQICYYQKPQIWKIRKLFTRNLVWSCPLVTEPTFGTVFDADRGRHHKSSDPLPSDDQTNVAAVPAGAHWLCLVSAHVMCIKLNLQETVKAFHIEARARCSGKYLKKCIYTNSALCLPSRCTLFWVNWISVAVEPPDWWNVT